MRRDTDAQARALLHELRMIENDRGAMAALRCALNPGKISRAWPVLGRLQAVGDPIAETVAGLYAYHPADSDSGNMGTTCRQLFADQDARIRRLLGCETGRDICRHVRPVILAARAKGVGINYEQLYKDLRFWSRPVKTRWATEYWQASDRANTDQETAS